MMARSGFLRPGPLALGLVLVAIVAAALYLTIRKPPYEVDVAQVTRGPLAVTVDDEGETRVRDLFIVASPINGRLLRIELEPGDPVAAGQTVVARLVRADADFLDPRSEARTRQQVQSLDAVVDSSASRVAEARAARTLAAQQQARIAALHQRGFASRAMLDQANAALAQAQAALVEAIRSVDAARHDRDAARANLLAPTGGARTGQVLEVRSPINGTVMRLPRESESNVAAGSPLIELGDPRNLEIVSDLLSADAVRIKPGASVVIENWGDKIPLHGKVRRIEPFGFTKISALGVEEQRVNVIIDITDPPALWARLGHGYRVIVRIAEWQCEDCLQVPVSALFRDKGAWAVFTERGGKARYVPVQIGRMNDEKAQVLGGLTKGDMVILHPGEKISDGVRVVNQ